MDIWREPLERRALLGSLLAYVGRDSCAGVCDGEGKQWK